MKNVFLAKDNNPFVEEDHREYLERVREHSCYKTLRSLITWPAVLLGFLGCSGLLVIVMLWFSLEPSEFDQRFLTGKFPIWSSILLCLFTITIAIAIRQASFLLIDIADILIDQNRRRWEFSGEPQKNVESSTASR